MQMYDIIGDIHGYAEHTKALLKKLGYQERGGAFRHPERQALFLGDLIDRGPEQIESVNLVRRMADAGSAIAVMGNHEYNAVAYATEDPDAPGEYLRPNIPRNRHQHQAFLEQVGEGSALHREFLEWFKTLPIAFENDHIRAIHACWHADHIAAIDHLLNTDGSLKDEAWVAMSRRGTPESDALETLLKGLEIELPEGMSYHDKDGVERFKTRTRWWDQSAVTYRQLGLVPSALQKNLPDVRVEGQAILTYDNAKPVFIGHYWMTGQPERLHAQIACLDYSIGKGCNTGKLCAYRWNGEASLNNEHFVWVDGSSSVIR